MGNNAKLNRGLSIVAAGHDGQIHLQTIALRLWTAIATTSLALLTACGMETDVPPLATAQLDRLQIEALQRMNAAGAAEVAGWTWQYEFGAGCRMRVIKRYEGRAVPMVEYAMSDHYADVISYPGGGFGVKAYPRSKAGSADLFEAPTKPLAAEFATNVERLMAACVGTASSLE